MWVESGAYITSVVDYCCIGGNAAAGETRRRERAELTRESRESEVATDPVTCEDLLIGL